jgi:hypothetical protein
VVGGATYARANEAASDGWVLAEPQYQEVAWQR